MAAPSNDWEETTTQQPKEDKNGSQPVAPEDVTPTHNAERAIPAPGRKMGFQEALQETLTENEELYRRLS
ncbi:MAG: hypothetical protein JO316_23050 [Abitibacteriaceae bacterium]|nr:hypothetical protein [Abditibacteriaceae bacterium]MBV9868243.1 hypothetical protein [Abditibacteriaceae bacterium]